MPKVPPQQGDALDSPVSRPRVSLNDPGPRADRLDDLPLCDDERHLLNELRRKGESRLNAILEATASLPVATQVALLRTVVANPDQLELVARLISLGGGDRSVTAEWCIVIAACEKALESLDELAEDPRELYRQRDGKGVTLLGRLSQLSVGPLRTELANRQGEPFVKHRVSELLFRLLSPSPPPKTRPYHRGALAIERALLRGGPAEYVTMVCALALEPVGEVKATSDGGPLALQLVHDALAAKLGEEGDGAEQAALLFELVGRPYRVWEADERQLSFLRTLASAEVELPVLVHVGGPRAFLGVSGDEVLLSAPFEPEPYRCAAASIERMVAPDELVRHHLEGKALPPLSRPKADWF